MERNVDKIKRLETDLRRSEYLMNQKHHEAEALKKDLDKFRNGTEDIQKAVDLVLIIVTVIYGDELENGNYILGLPRMNNSEALNGFDLQVKGISPDGSEYILEAAVKKEKESAED